MPCDRSALAAVLFPTRIARPLARSLFHLARCVVLLRCVAILSVSADCTTLGSVALELGKSCKAYRSDIGTDNGTGIVKKKSDKGSDRTCLSAQPQKAATVRLLRKQSSWRSGVPVRACCVFLPKEPKEGAVPCSHFGLASPRADGMRSHRGLLPSSTSSSLWQNAATIAWTSVS